MSEGQVEEILGFWFGPETDQKTIIDSMAGVWWGKKQEIDQDIYRRFGELHRRRNRLSETARVILLNVADRVVMVS